MSHGNLRTALMGAVFGCALMAAPAANAAFLLSSGASTTINLSGNVGGTALSATAAINVTSFSASQIVASFTLTNTTPSATPGQNRLVSFGFDFEPSVGIFSVVANTIVSGWGVTANSQIPSYGNVDVCAWDGNNCSGGSNDGVGEGLSESFVLTFSGSFTQPLAFDGFVARYQSIGANGLSGFITQTPNGPDPGPVPEPATLALLGAGLVGLGLARRRRRTA